MAGLERLAICRLVPYAVRVCSSFPLLCWPSVLMDSSFWFQYEVQEGSQCNFLKAGPNQTLLGRGSSSRAPRGCCPSVPAPSSQDKRASSSCLSSLCYKDQGPTQSIGPQETLSPPPSLDFVCFLRWQLLCGFLF